MSKVRLVPLFARIIVEFEDENPHRQKMTKSGILIPSEKIQLLDKEANGIVEGGEQRIKYGVVVEAAEDCKYVKEGDEVICDYFQGMPLVMGLNDLKLLPETAVL